MKKNIKTHMDALKALYKGFYDIQGANKGRIQKTYMATKQTSKVLWVTGIKPAIKRIDKFFEKDA